MAADYKTLLGLVREFVGGYERMGVTEDSEDGLLFRARAAIAPSAPKNDPAILHAWPMVADDMCCSKTLAQTAKLGRLDGAKGFACPKCGTDFLPRQEGSITTWEPVNDIEVFRLP